MRRFRDPKSRTPDVALAERDPARRRAEATWSGASTTYGRWLATSEVPKLLLAFEPGAILGPSWSSYCRVHIRHLEVRHLGRGSHFVQEDQPEAIGDAIREWRGRVLAA